MNVLSFRGLFILSCISAASLYFKPWEHAKDPAAGVVAGKIVDSDGHGIAGASIVLRDKEGIVAGRAESAAGGDFQFDNCQPGRYRIAAVQPAIGGGERAIYVDSHTRADGTIRLVSQMTGRDHR